MSTKSKTISEKMAELDSLIAWFDSDDFSLEAAVAHYEKAEALATEISKDLETMKNTVHVLDQKFDNAA